MQGAVFLNAGQAGIITALAAAAASSVISRISNRRLYKQSDIGRAAIDISAASLRRIIGANLDAMKSDPTGIIRPGPGISAEYAVITGAVENINTHAIVGHMDTGLITFLSDYAKYRRQ